jgi:hypothetical protein
MKIVNLTQHTILAEQAEAGVFDLPGVDHDILIRLLNFDILPSGREINNRAFAIAELAEKYKPDQALIGGAPFLMGALERSLRGNSITPVYAFSVRESVEEIIDGHLIKTSVFKHQGFVNPRI